MSLRYIDNFPNLIKDFRFSSLEENEYSVFALDENLQMIYQNPAWNKFYKRNKGFGELSDRFGIGSKLLAGIKGKELKNFYKDKYLEVINQNMAWLHEYECSSLYHYRVFQQSAYPLLNKKGVLVISSLKIEVDMSVMEREAKPFEPDHHVDKYNKIHQCGNCRQTLNVEGERSWDWVPELLDGEVLMFNFTVCPNCLESYGVQ